MARTGSSTPAMSTMVSSRDRLSRGVFACTVVIEPSWPVFMACSMSRAAPSRDLTDDDPVRPHTEAVADELADGDRAATLDVRRARLESKHVLLVELELSGILDGDDALVLRDEGAEDVERRRLARPVPPLMMMFRRPRTQALRKSRTCSLMVPKEMRSRSVKGSAANLRMVRSEPSRATGETTALTREPSGSRASTMGLDSSTRRPTRATILSMVRRRCDSSPKAASTGKIRPSRSMKMSPGPLTMISVTSGSRR